MHFVEGTDFGGPSGNIFYAVGNDVGDPSGNVSYKPYCVTLVPQQNTLVIGGNDFMANYAGRSLFQTCDFFRDVRDALLGGLDGRLGVRYGRFHALLLVISGIQRHVAVLLHTHVTPD